MYQRFDDLLISVARRNARWRREFASSAGCRPEIVGRESLSETKAALRAA